jgi:periplasmic protein TorT
VERSPTQQSVVDGVAAKEPRNTACDFAARPEINDRGGDDAQAARCGIGGDRGSVGYPGQTVLAEDQGNWTYDVKGGPDGNSTNMKWSNIEKSKITKPWRLCALFPQMKNVYWVAGSFGLVTEARRDNVNLQLFEAGGYGNLSTQLNQMDNCIASGYDAIIIAAISADGVAPLVRKAVAKGIPVIDYANGINEPATSAHATVSFIDLGKLAGQYVLDHTEPKSTVVGFFAGPQGANFSDDAVKGFEEAIKGSPLKVAVTRRGDASLNVQLDLVQNWYYEPLRHPRAPGLSLAGVRLVIADRA